MTGQRSTQLTVHGSPFTSAPRADILAAIRGQRVRPLPVFSGLPSLTATGLRGAAVRYCETHCDAAKMSAAAASTFELFGFASAVVPFDLCVEAEALGCVVDYQSDVDSFLAPVVVQPHNIERYQPPSDFDPAHGGRVPVVADALARLQARVGRETVIGACVPGPFTLAWQMFGAEAWLASCTETLHATPLLKRLADFIARVAAYYRNAGADFITVHEMGGSPQVIGPATFRAVVKPHLSYLFKQLPSPNVLSICGDTNAIIADMAACDADALSVDQRNHLARSRRVLGDDVILFGNLDPMGVLAHGTPDEIRAAVRAIRDAGANAIWPGCDLVVETPDKNMRALVDG